MLHVHSSFTIDYGEGCDLDDDCLHIYCLVLQLGHMPQEDYPEAIQDTIELFLLGETDAWEPGRVVSARMTKKGVVEAGV
jgi:hypothetical protein